MSQRENVCERCERHSELCGLVVRGAGHIALVADIGGTHARFAIADIDNGKILEYKKFRVSEFASPEAVTTRYLASVTKRPTVACFAIAGPVSGEVIRLTNADWTFTRDKICDVTGLKSLMFVNDFEALAHALPSLSAMEYRQIGGKIPVEHATKVVVGPGTGLGVAALAWSQAGWMAISGEGGHVSFAIENSEEFEILNRLRTVFGHVSAEKLISGPGLSHIYRILCGLNGRSAVQLQASLIVDRANSEADALAKRAVELFAKWLGRFSGDAALTLGARGGVYVAGGIPPRILDTLIAGHFRQGFEAKGRMSDYLSQIPTYVILIEDAGLRGAAHIIAALPEISAS